MPPIALCILATSREGLGITGETVWRVPSLSLPDLSQAASVETLLRHDAVRLFIERAAAVDSTFAVTAANAATVAEVCVRLDGIPLAIELAAARVKVLSLAQIHARLNDRFRLLTGGSRTAVARQRTLEATVEWSYGLLSGAERRLLRRLSVFAGGWTMEAAEDGDVGRRAANATTCWNRCRASWTSRSPTWRATARGTGGITSSRPCVSTRGSASSNQAKPNVCATVIWRSFTTWLDAPSPS